MAEFAHNNIKASAIGISPFFLNKGFHPRISFDVDLQMNESETARERLQRARAKDISKYIQKALDAATEALKKSQEVIIKTANRKRKDITYELKDIVFLSSKNIKT